MPAIRLTLKHPGRQQLKSEDQRVILKRNWLIILILTGSLFMHMYDTRKYSFSARIVNIWNSLPNFVVDVDTVCVFKTRLDTFWMHQDVMYDFAADLTGIGDRSVREIT